MAKTDSSTTDLTGIYMLSDQVEPTGVINAEFIGQKYLLVHLDDGTEIEAARATEEELLRIKQQFDLDQELTDGPAAPFADWLLATLDWTSYETLREVEEQAQFEEEFDPGEEMGPPAAADVGREHPMNQPRPGWKPS